MTNYHQIEIISCEYKVHKQIGYQKEYKDHKILVVVNADTIVNPRAMVIESFYTLVASSTVS